MTKKTQTHASAKHSSGALTHPLPAQNETPLNADTNPKKWLIGICKPAGGGLCRWHRHDYYPSKRKAKNALEALLETDSHILAYIILKDGKSNTAAERLYQHLTR